jgi:hypothetical protein
LIGTGFDFESKTMELWKPLALIVPAGLLLGMIGGKLAHPVMQQRAVEPWQSIFGARAQPYGATDYPVQPEGPMTYVGGYSYPPDTGEWSRPYDKADWTYADVPLPTIAELDARQAELLADPDVEFAVSSPANEVEPAAEEPPQVALAPADTGPEPRTADGGLPAIW